MLVVTAVVLLCACVHYFVLAVTTVVLLCACSHYCGTPVCLQSLCACSHYFGAALCLQSLLWCSSFNDRCLSARYSLNRDTGYDSAEEEADADIMAFLQTMQTPRTQPKPETKPVSPAPGTHRHPIAQTPNRTDTQLHRHPIAQTSD